MKKLSWLLLAGSLLLSGPLFSATFEGRITMKMTSADSKSKDQPPLMKMSLKEGFYRTDMEATTKEGTGVVGGMIMDYKKQEMIILMPQQKMYMVRALTTPDAGSGKDKTELKNTSDLTVERTGEKEKILGYTCEKILVKSKDSSSEIWATDQLGTFMGSSAAGSPGGGGGGFMGRGKRDNAQVQAWEQALNGKDFFPLRVVTLDKKGKESFRMEATSIEKKSLDASEFVPPADYQKFDMGDMMKGMMGGFGK